MKIDFSRVLWDEKGEAITTDDEYPVSLAYAAIEALKAQYKPEFDKPAEGERYRRGKLIHTIAHEGEVELVAEDIALIKKLIDLRWGPMIVFPAYELLEGRCREGGAPTPPIPNGRRKPDLRAVHDPAS